MVTKVSVGHHDDPLQMDHYRHEKEDEGRPAVSTLDRRPICRFQMEGLVLLLQEDSPLSNLNDPLRQSTR